MCTTRCQQHWADGFREAATPQAAPTGTPACHSFSSPCHTLPQADMTAMVAHYCGLREGVEKVKLTGLDRLGLNGEVGAVWVRPGSVSIGSLMAAA